MTRAFGFLRTRNLAATRRDHPRMVVVESSAQLVLVVQLVPERLAYLRLAGYPLPPLAWGRA